jgi:RNA-binding protein YhbY
MKLEIILFCSLCLSLTTSFTLQPLTESRLSNKNYFPLKLSANDDDSAQRVNIDKAWKHIPKPLLRIGGKGVADSHGNSLKELMNAHTAVKVKINTTKLGSFEDVFEMLKVVLEKKDVQGVELIHVRESDNTIMVAKSGTMDKIQDGSFPPPPPPPPVEEEGEEVDTF